MTLCTAWSIYHLYASLVLLAHRQSAVLPSQLVGNQSCQSSFSVPSRILVSHAADHSTGNRMCCSSSRQSYCCRESYSHPGRLLADRGLKRRLDISKIVLVVIYQSMEAWCTGIQRRCHIGKSTLGLENSFFDFIKSTLHFGLPHCYQYNLHHLL